MCGRSSAAIATPRRSPTAPAASTTNSSSLSKTWTTSATASSRLAHPTSVLGRSSPTGRATSSGKSSAWESWPRSGRNGSHATAPAPAPNKPPDLAGERAPNHHIGGLTPSFLGGDAGCRQRAVGFLLRDAEDRGAGFKRLRSPRNKGND